MSITWLLLTWLDECWKVLEGAESGACLLALA